MVFCIKCLQFCYFMRKSVIQNSSHMYNSQSSHSITSLPYIASPRLPSLYSKFFVAFVFLHSVVVEIEKRCLGGRWRKHFQTFIDVNMLGKGWELRSLTQDRITTSKKTNVVKVVTFGQWHWLIFIKYLLRDWGCLTVLVDHYQSCFNITNNFKLFDLNNKHIS